MMSKWSRWMCICALAAVFWMGCGDDDDLVCEGGTSECGAECADLMVDLQNCGECGNVCGAGEVCSDGECAVSCGEGLDECENSCRDYSTDRNHCGECGNACEAGEVCSDGECALSCGGFLDECEYT